MERVRVGFLGAGRFANEVHYPSLAEFSDVSIVAVCDVDQHRLLATADAWGVRDRFTDLQHMLDQATPDAVYICMPPHQLFDPVVECLRRGLHVFVEKPPGVSAEQTRSFARLAESSGSLTMVGFNRRFMPALVRAVGAVRERGEITHCAASYYKHYLADSPYYDGPATMLVLDGIHAVDALRWVGGEVDAVASSVGRYANGYANSFRAMIRFAGGCTGFLSADWAAGKRIQTLEMHSTGVSAFVNVDESAVIWKDDSEQPEVLDVRRAAGSDEFRVYYGFREENRHFIDCVKTGQEPLTSFADAVLTMELAERLQCSL